MIIIHYAKFHAFAKNSTIMSTMLPPHYSDKKIFQLLYGSSKIIFIPKYEFQIYRICLKSITFVEIVEKSDKVKIIVIKIKWRTIPKI